MYQELHSTLLYGKPVTAKWVEVCADYNAVLLLNMET
jgi:hypothetical protein